MSIFAVFENTINMKWEMRSVRCEIMLGLRRTSIKAHITHRTSKNKKERKEFK